MALVSGIGTPRREAAAGRQVRRIRRHPGDHGQFSAERAFQIRDGVEQPLSVRVKRVSVQRLNRAVLHHRAGVHDRHVIAGLRHDPKVVGYQQQGRLHLLLKLVDKIQHLSLNRHVKSRRRLVGDEQAGPAGQGDSDANALAHAAGELVREVLAALGPNAHHLQHLVSPLQRLGALQIRVKDDHLHDLLLHRHDRVERGHWVLEDHGDFAAAHVTLFRFGHLPNVAAAEENLAFGYFSGRRLNELQYRQGRRRLAGSGLADEAERFSALKPKVQSVDSVHDPRVGVELHRQILDIKKNIAHGRPTASAWDQARLSGRRQGS